MTLKEIHEKIAKNSRKNKSVPQMDKFGKMFALTDDVERNSPKNQKKISVMDSAEKWAKWSVREKNI